MRRDGVRHRRVTSCPITAFQDGARRWPNSAGAALPSRGPRCGQALTVASATARVTHIVVSPKFRNRQDFCGNRSSDAIFFRARPRVMTGECGEAMLAMGLGARRETTVERGARQAVAASET